MNLIVKDMHVGYEQRVSGKLPAYQADSTRPMTRFYTSAISISTRPNDLSFNRQIDISFFSHTCERFHNLLDWRPQAR